MKLFTIGDSISQGFMSGAAARTDLAFSTLIAEAMGLTQGPGYQIPAWSKGGHPVNLESLLRLLTTRFGRDIHFVEWPFALGAVSGYLDEVEDFYERGPGHERAPYGAGQIEYFHNIAIRGYTVADAWLVTPRLCVQQIAADPDGGDDGMFQTTDHSFYRTALTVLNPSRNADHDDFSALRWLEAHATNETGEGGVENLIVWLGSNNALGAMMSLHPVPTSGDGSIVGQSQPDRDPYNLWHEQDFEREYQELVSRIDAIMARNVAPNWKVYVATVPAVTVIPLVRGVGQRRERRDPFGVLARTANYFEYYTYFPFDKSFAKRAGVGLPVGTVLSIDRRIARYNLSIRGIVNEWNRRHGETRYVVVDINRSLVELAFRRNGRRPIYRLPPALAALPRPPDTRSYAVDERGEVVAGGIFSLDGVHPTAIGHGLLAHEFLREMRNAGSIIPGDLDWSRILMSDTLWQNPVPLVREAFQNRWLVKRLIRAVHRKLVKSSRTPPPLQSLAG